MAKKVAKKPAATSTEEKATVTKSRILDNPTRAARADAFREVLVNRFRGPISWGQLAAEFIGTAILSLIVLNSSNNFTLVFLALVVLVLIFGPVSGAHLNPALTIGLWSTRIIRGSKALAYIIAQFLGAMLAYVIANSLLPGTPDPTTGAQPQLFRIPEFAQGSEPLWRAFGAEALGVLVFSLGVASIFLARRGLMAAAFTFGGAFLFGVIAAQSAGATPLLNPAVATAVQAYSGQWQSWLIYGVTPLVVAILGMNLFKYLNRSASDPTNIERL